MSAIPESLSNTVPWMASPDYELLCAGLDPPKPVKAAELRIPAADEVALAATLYEPRGPRPKLAVLISSATGVPRSYYRHFAEFLAENGCVALAYDYRGIGGSRDAGSGARMRDWGEQDLAGALEWLLHRYPRLPLAAVGHSSGGWLLGLAANNRSADALLAVGSQDIHWRHWPSLRGKLFTWNGMLMIPAVTRLFGHLPGAALGGESLPRGVALDWARWIRHSVVDDAGTPLREHFRAYTNPVRLYAVSDDLYAPEPAVRGLAAMFANAPAEVRVVRPREHGLRKLGHFGFFRKNAPRALWDEALRWLRQQTGA